MRPPNVSAHPAAEAGLAGYVMSPGPALQDSRTVYADLWVLLLVMALIFGLYKYFNRVLETIPDDRFGDELLRRFDSMDHRLTHIREAVAGLDRKLDGRVPK